jgi:hypothetical protein
MAKQRKSVGGTSSKRPKVEWVGGRYELPFWITEDEPYRPDLVIWSDASSGVALDHQVVHPEESDDCVIESLKNALLRISQKPTTIRVENPELSRRIKKVVGKDIRVRVAPTPEAEQFFELMVSTLESEKTEKSYLEDGRVSSETACQFFDAAADLYRTTPWKIVPTDDAVIGIDAPEFDLEEACISVIGQQDQDYGFILFDSTWDFELFLGYAYDHLDGGGDDLLPAVPVLSVVFARPQSISALMRDEIKKHHWAIAGPTAFPHIVAFSEDRIERPLTAADVELATVCCRALTEFLKKNGSAFKTPLTEPICEQIVFEGEPRREPVQITLPNPGLRMGPLSFEHDEFEEPLDLDGEGDLREEEVKTVRKPLRKKQVKKSK